MKYINYITHRIVVVVELFLANDTDIIDLLMRSFHKDYTLFFNVYARDIKYYSIPPCY